MSDTSTEPVELSYTELVVERDESILFEIDSRPIWLPRSEIVEHDAERKVVTIPEWLAIDREVV